VKLCNETLEVPITSQDISAAFPLVKGTVTVPSVSLVRFVRQVDRDKVFLAKRKLSERNGIPSAKKVYINEDLPVDSRKLLGALRRLVKSHNLGGAWSYFGKVLAKRLDGSIVTVTKLSDLNIPNVQHAP
jgi:hypothetical protein